jgi:hypothetical protein
MGDVTHVSEVHAAYNFWVEGSHHKPVYAQILPLYPEYGGIMYLRNVGKIAHTQ